MNKAKLYDGWEAVDLGDRVIIRDENGNVVYSSKSKLEDVARIFSIGRDVGHISTANSFKGKLGETVTRPPLALDPDECPLTPPVAEAIACEVVEFARRFREICREIEAWIDSKENSDRP